jgi:hypothetical protein
MMADVLVPEQRLAAVAVTHSLCSARCGLCGTLDEMLSP